MSKTSELLQDEDFVQIVRRKNTIAGVLTALTLLVYFGYMGLIAFHPAALAARVGAATLGIPLGIGVILMSWLITGLYVRWANSTYDAMVERVRAKHGEQL